jgi:hypothetical protein
MAIEFLTLTDKQFLAKKDYSGQFDHLKRIQNGQKYIFGGKISLSIRAQISGPLLRKIFLSLPAKHEFPI